MALILAVKLVLSYCDLSISTNIYLVNISNKDKNSMILYFNIVTIRVKVRDKKEAGCNTRERNYLF